MSNSLGKSVSALLADIEQAHLAQQWECSAAEDAASESEWHQRPHGVEQLISQSLLEHPEWGITSLVVRRLPEGICLQGVLESETDCRSEIEDLARKVGRVNRVLNRMVVRQPVGPLLPR